MKYYKKFKKDLSFLIKPIKYVVNFHASVPSILLVYHVAVVLSSSTATVVPSGGMAPIDLLSCVDKPQDTKQSIIRFANWKQFILFYMDGCKIMRVRSTTSY